MQEKHYHDILRAFDSCESTNVLYNAWKLVKQLSGNKSKTVFIQEEDRLDAWKTYFKQLLSPDNPRTSNHPVDPIYETNPNTDTDIFSLAEIYIAIKQIKLGKATGLDDIPIEVWRLPNLRKDLLKFCNKTYLGNRLPEWGISGIVPIHKKGDLTIHKNYRGISLTQSAAKVYNRLLLNRIRPELEKILRPNQNGFRPLRSTSSQILGLRRIIEETRNYQKEAAIIFIDFKKAFDSVDRNTPFQILHAYGIPEKIVKAIQIMYVNTSAVVLTSDGETTNFNITTGVLQGDHLAPYMFIKVLDYI